VDSDSQREEYEPSEFTTVYIYAQSTISINDDDTLTIENRLSLGPEKVQGPGQIDIDRNWQALSASLQNDPAALKIVQQEGSAHFLPKVAEVPLSETTKEHLEEFSVSDLKEPFVTVETAELVLRAGEVALASLQAPFFVAAVQ
jgi:hypothetical protein